MVLFHFLLLTSILAVTYCLPRPETEKPNDPQPGPLLLIIEQPLGDQAVPQGQQQSTEQRQSTRPAQQPAARQQEYQPNLRYPGVPFLEPRFQYPEFNLGQGKQAYPRVQPQIVIYGPSGQGQPILINPGSPPGNFLVPQQPGPNFIYRDGPPQSAQRPVLVAGYPKPAHVPAIEKDAEEIPTNPAMIPPFQSGRRPEKLETFNEGKNDYPTKPLDEPREVLPPADRHPQLIPRTTNLKPGQRYFILNGEPLFQNYPYQGYPENILRESQHRYTQPQVLQQQHVNYNSVPDVMRNSLTDHMSSNAYPRFAEAQENFVGSQSLPQEAFFRSALPYEGALDGENIDPMGQFRFSPPSDPYFPFNQEDVENDSIVVDAAAEDEASDSSSNTKSESERVTLRPYKSPEPSTAQAAPGAIALAGPGGVAGASPRATALVGKGGLAISSPQATAVAGPKDEQSDKKPADKLRNK